ncbi:MAG: hypothetical protein AAGC78_03555 [Cellvibrio sp.]|uniref:hypothetical protein n=1 Tax=Cellvibrio sp. TaxID=1965322 RepID=UPI0031A8111A
MNKVLVIIVVFAAGALCGYQFSVATDKSSPSPLPFLKNNPVADNVASVNESPSVTAAVVKNDPDELIKSLSVQTPKTQFERYRAFQKLDQLSVDEIEQLLCQSMIPSWI